MGDARQARVNRDTAGDPLGISVALSADELRDLGVDVDRAEAVEYVVEDGHLSLAAAGKDAPTPTL